MSLLWAKITTTYYTNFDDFYNFLDARFFNDIDQIKNKDSRTKDRDYGSVPKLLLTITKTAPKF